MALHHGMQMVADLGPAAVEAESGSTLALAALQQKEQDYCVFGLIYFMMARLRSNAIVHCAWERDGRPTRLRIEFLTVTAWAIILFINRSRGRLLKQKLLSTTHHPDYQV